jgi:[NiFe] hydrogenase diaphorase moiety large subunit
MSDQETTIIQGIVDQFGQDRGRLLSIVQAVQGRLGYLPRSATRALAAALHMHQVEVEDMVSFYTFLDREPKGAFRVRLARTPVSFLRGAAEVARAFETALGIPMGGTTADGQFSLAWTSDIGMADQEPSALVNGSVLTNIAAHDVAEIVAALRRSTARATLPQFPALEQPALTLPHARVRSNLMQGGPVLFTPMKRGAGLRVALTMPPEAVLTEITRARLRGRGGAGFPTGLKWRSCRQAPGPVRHVLCNADEGEPGTFKDRVLLTETPDYVFEGMTIAGYAVGAQQGIVYLRGEYAYLWSFLHQVLAERRRVGLLGANICGQEGFDFDLRIQLGAGAYICGEESALIESLEGKRGAPRARPPFPTERGYLQQPTVVNNVETFACVTRILEKGSGWFTQFGTRESTGTKLMSVAGDCAHPGVYEVPFGITVNELLDLAGAADAAAVQVSGPAGQCVAPKDFGRQLCFEDLPTGGSTMVFGPHRDLLEIVRQFAEFFVEESCGWCVPCRVGTTLLRMKLDKILAGRGTLADVHELEKLGQTVARTSFCGLGQTAPNPVLTTLRHFPHLYEARLQPADTIPLFDLEASLRAAVAVQGRLPSPEEVQA